MKSTLRIIVTGLVGLYPVGGVAWDYLQYLIGLSRLGHDVYYHEDTWCWPYHTLKRTYTSDGSYSAKYLEDFFIRYAPNLKYKWHYLHLHDRSYGMDKSKFVEVAKTADLFLNVSGASIIPDIIPQNCIKVFLDTDPGYNQIMLSERPVWSENIERWCKCVSDHDKFFTYAENIHDSDCLIPKMDFAWETTRMPIVLEIWAPFARFQSPKSAPWTTVMSWKEFKGKLTYQGVEYKSKGAEFEKILDLPLLTDIPFKVAVGGMETPRMDLAKHGWQVIDGPEATAMPYQYQKFISQSRGEISSAKHVYVAMRSGWFSCRSAVYLAMGKPVVVEDTGFSKSYPTGLGLWGFENVDEAANAIKAVNGDYSRQCKAARAIAEEFFRAETVLKQLLNNAGL